MAEQSGFWTTSGTGDGPATGYTMNDWRDFLNRVFAPGQEANGAVIKAAGNELAVAGSATPISVATGQAIVNGFWYENNTSLNLAITSPVVNTTGFRVVLRASWAAQTIRATIIKNTDGISAIPAATQVDGTTWDVTLATGTITTGGVITLTDARNYLRTAGIPPLNSVDDDEIGNRVAMLPNRQGGNATNWHTSGTTNYTPTAVKEFYGVIAFGAVAAGSSISVVVTFPVAFSVIPIVLTSPMNGSVNVSTNVSSVSATQATIIVFNNDSGSVSGNIAWHAIGAE
jgi:hypothetical protein